MDPGGILLFVWTCFLAVISSGFAEVYSNTWVVYTEKNKAYVDEIAQKRGFINHGQLGELEGHYLLEHKKLGSRMRRSLTKHTVDFLQETHIKYAEQQKVLRRQKREPFSDPYFGDQWYIHNTGQTPGPKGLDINVFPVWKKNITGKNVVVTILDDGIEYTHPDLKDNYEPSASWDYNSKDSDPSPRYTSDNLNKHGTRCAGEVAAKSKNNICGVGVAYNARIGGVRMLDGEVTDGVEGASLSHKSNFIDIYSSSWGPDDDGRTVDGPGTHAKKAFREGIRRGRKGLGSIFVWATGNGGKFKDYCNCDGYITSIYTISIGAVDDRGKSPWYAEPCPATLAVTYSSGAANVKVPDLKIVTTDLNHKCTKDHSGTSAAAPLAAGMFALVLEANPNLTWRDFQHLVVNTSKKNDPGDGEWIINGAGHHVNNKYGFGVLDTAGLVDLATHPKWKTANEQHVCREPGDISEKVIPSSGTLTTTLTSTGCKGKSNSITRLEHVRVYITISHPRRGSLSITLISPSGTQSDLLRKRDRDYSSVGFQNWPFMTVFSWGENPQGNWTLKITNHDQYVGTFKAWTLILYGTVETNYQISAAEKQACLENCKKSCPISFGEVCHNCSLYCDCEMGECVRFCDEEDEVDEVRRHCLSPFFKRSQKNDFSDSDSGDVSTFVKWLIIFSLLGVLMVTALIIYFLKVSGRLCWRTRPITDTTNTNPVEQNAGHSANDSSRCTGSTAFSQNSNGTVSCTV